MNFLWETYKLEIAISTGKVRTSALQNRSVSPGAVQGSECDRRLRTPAMGCFWVESQADCDFLSPVPTSL